MNRWTNRCAQTAETGAIHLYIYIHLRRVERTPGAISPARIARVIDQNWARHKILISTARGMARCPFARQAAHPGYGSMPIHPPSVSTNAQSKTVGDSAANLASTAVQTHSANRTAHHTQESAHLEVEASVAAEVSQALLFNAAVYPSHRSVNMLYPVHGSSSIM